MGSTLGGQAISRSANIDVAPSLCTLVLPTVSHATSTISNSIVAERTLATAWTTSKLATIGTVVPPTTLLESVLAMAKRISIGT